MITRDLLLHGLLYLSPSLFMALVIRYLSRRVLVAWFIQLPGTVVHELLHFLVGFFTFAGPTSISILPSRYGKGLWTLGGATFRNLRWYNAALVCMAPLLCLPLCAWLVFWRLKGVPSLSIMDPVYWFAAASLLIAAWPSPQDARLAMRSWPLVPIAIAVFCFYYPAIGRG